MNKQLNMIASPKEDMEMMDIINENHRKSWEKAIRKAKKDKRDTIIANIIIYVGLVVGTIGLLLLLSMVEHLTF